ncbi:21 kDa protein-like [Diospyros lotus]|uniref:21 kDa protein-like n=1 Tax=Diospyros lotus TaxID=55363 RepID=UPI0022550A8B|nr:21 kDa protein-like [Diospyros lotus]
MKNQSPFSLSTLRSFSAIVFLFYSVSAEYSSELPPNSSNAAADDEFIRTSCGQTQYPDLCYASLSAYAGDVQQDPARLACAAINVSLSTARDTACFLSNISRQASSGRDRTAAALHDCVEVFHDAVAQLRGSLRQMRKLGSGGEPLKFQLSNVQTWMSAALTNEDTCTDGFEDVPDGGVKMGVCDRVGEAKKVTSNALALVNLYVSKVSSP